MSDDVTITRAELAAALQALGHWVNALHQVVLSMNNDGVATVSRRGPLPAPSPMGIQCDLRLRILDKDIVDPEP